MESAQEAARRANELQTLRYIEAGKDLLRGAEANIRLRVYQEADTDEYEVLTQEIAKCLALAKVTCAMAQNVEDEAVEGEAGGGG